MRFILKVAIIIHNMVVCDEMGNIRVANGQPESNAKQCWINDHPIRRDVMLATKKIGMKFVHFLPTKQFIKKKQ